MFIDLSKTAYHRRRYTYIYQITCPPVSMPFPSPQHQELIEREAADNGQLTSITTCRCEDTTHIKTSRDDNLVASLVSLFTQHFSLQERLGSNGGLLWQVGFVVRSFVIFPTKSICTALLTTPHTDISLQILVGQSKSVKTTNIYTQCMKVSFLVVALIA